MIQDLGSATARDEARIVIRPNRSLSARQLIWIVCGFALVAGAISALSWLQGNAFAPLFALLEVIWFAGCLAWVWRRTGRCEVIIIDPQRVCVRYLPELVDNEIGHPTWVHVDSEGERLALCANGRQVEVGNCLNAVERQQLGRRLQELLRRARQGAETHQRL